MPFILAFHFGLFTRAYVENVFVAWRLMRTTGCQHLRSLKRCLAKMYFSVTSREKNIFVPLTSNVPLWCISDANRLITYSVIVTLKKKKLALTHIIGLTGSSPSFPKHYTLLFIFDSKSDNCILKN